MCDESLNHKEIECLDKLASCIVKAQKSIFFRKILCKLIEFFLQKIVTAQIREMNKSMIVKGCQTNCVESRQEVEANLTVTTECCSENLCNLFSQTEDFQINNNSKDTRTPIPLIRLDSIDWLDLFNQTNDTIYAEIGINSTSNNNSRDRLITSLGSGNPAMTILSAVDRFFFYAFAMSSVLVMLFS